MQTPPPPPIFNCCNYFLNGTNKIKNILFCLLLLHLNGCTTRAATALLRASPSCHLGLVPWLCGSRSGLNPPPDPAYALVGDFPHPSCPVLVLPKISRLPSVLMHTNMHFPIYHILYMYSADQEQFHLVPILSETHAVSSVFSEFSLVNKLLNSTRGA